MKAVFFILFAAFAQNANAVIVNWNIPNSKIYNYNNPSGPSLGFADALIVWNTSTQQITEMTYTGADFRIELSRPFDYVLNTIDYHQPGYITYWSQIIPSLVLTRYQGIDIEPVSIGAMDGYFEWYQIPEGVAPPLHQPFDAYMTIWHEPSGGQEVQWVTAYAETDDIHVVSEPATLSLLALGLVAIGIRRRLI